MTRPNNAQSEVVQQVQQVVFGERHEAAASALGPILASVYWPQRLFQGDRVQARMEGPFEPAVALSYAEEIAKLYQFPRVVVAIQARTLWNDAWGRLAPDEGFD